MDEGGENKIEEGESDYVFVEDIGDSDWDAAVFEERFTSTEVPMRKLVD